MEIPTSECNEIVPHEHRCLQVRVTRPFHDLSGVFQGWWEKCEQLLVVQHPPDGKTKRCHCHILMINPIVRNDQLQKPLRNMNLKGNTDFMFSFVIVKGKYKGEPYKRDKTAIYMIKGKYEVQMNKGFTTEELEEFKTQWVGNSDDTEVIEPKNKDDSEWDYFLRKFEQKVPEGMTMIGIRRWIRADCLGRRKPVPRAGDVNRWAFSIYAITQNKQTFQDQEDLETMAQNQNVKID